MFPLSLLSWWYTTGWSDQARLISNRFARVSDFFSIGLLLKSLFAPFRQTFADGGGPSFDAKLRAWADRTISRCIGAMVRSAIIIVGALALIGEVLLAVIRLVAWPLLPILPIIGVILMSTGWVPWG